MATHHGIGDLYAGALCSFGHQRQDGDRFGRMFPELPGLYLRPDVLLAVGDVKGKMRAAGNAAPTATVPVGHVFFGQFIDHDITLDVESSVSSVNTPSEITNTRTPTLDLDCVYGQGPEAQPYLYDSDDGSPFKGVKLAIGGAGKKSGNDLPRFNDVALIGDFRNDENRIVSQIQLGMIKVHNAFCHELRTTTGLSGHDLYEEARRHTTWHYQWAVVHDFLVTLCGASTVTDILCDGRHFYLPSKGDPFMPVEFSVAAYRFGHSMVPQKVRTKKAKATKHALFGPDSMGAFTAVKSPDHIVDWPAVFALGSTKPQTAEQCDAKLAAVLLALPFIDEERPPEERSLATRNLRRGQSFLLPSGQQVARAMGRTEAEIKKVNAAAVKVHAELDGCTPLWLYCLIEGSVLGRAGVAADKGEGLGPVGGRIVAEVIIGLLECDPRSWLASDRSWTPECDRDTIGGLLQWAAT